MAARKLRGHYYGQVDLTTTLAKSLNSVAAQLAQEVGAKRMIDVAQRLGINAFTSQCLFSVRPSEVTLLELTGSMCHLPMAVTGPSLTLSSASQQPMVRYFMKIRAMGEHVYQPASHGHDELYDVPHT